MNTLTKPQRKALHKVWLRTCATLPAPAYQSYRPYRAFRRTVQPGPGCVMVQFAGMWLGIEPDGYTHS